MTQEEKAKAYDEALERAKKFAIDDAYASQGVVAKLIFPELRESEDERIRKMCIAAVNIAASADGGLHHSEASECLSWLEEQKDKNCLACDQHLKGYIAGRKATEEEKQKENPKNADSIPADCASNAKCEDRDSKYGVFPEDVIVVARACEKLEAHGYPELAHALKNVNLYTKPVDYDHEMWKNCEANFEGGKKEVIDHPEKYGLQKEQKPELVQHPPITFTFNSNASRDERLKAALLALLNSNLLKVKEGGYFTKQDLIEWVERIPTDKPAERIKATLNGEPIPTENQSVDIPLAKWSEEDEMMLKCCLIAINHYEKTCNIGDHLPTKFNIGGYLASVDKVKSWLKSLRPSWKPSEAQMEALKDAKMRMSLDGWGLCPLLQSLINELESL